MAGEEQRTDKSLALTDERHGGLRQAWESQTAFKISGGFLLVLAALGIWVAISGKPGTTTTAHAPAAPAQQQVIIGSTTPTATTNNATSCSLPIGDQDVPSQAAPSDVSWGQIGSMSVPQAPQTYGPQHDDGTWAWCFAHNPSGALMAGYNFWAEGTAAPPAEVYQRYAADTPTKAKAIASVAHSPSGLQGPGPVQVIGYRYGSYTPTNADFALLFQGPEGGCLGVSFDMAWEDDDWRYVIPAAPTPAMQRVACTTSGYVQWGGLA
jgi:hypothetical protein